MSIKNFNQKNVHFAETKTARFFRVAWRVLFEQRKKGDYGVYDRIQHDKEGGLTLFTDGITMGVTDMDMPDTMEHGVYQQAAQPAVETGLLYLEKKEMHPGRVLDAALNMVQRQAAKDMTEIYVSPKILIETLELFRGDPYIIISIESATSAILISSPPDQEPHTLAAIMPMLLPARIDSKGKPSSPFQWITDYLKRKQAKATGEKDSQ